MKVNVDKGKTSRNDYLTIGTVVIEITMTNKSIIRAEDHITRQANAATMPAVQMTYQVAAGTTGATIQIE